MAVAIDASLSRTVGYGFVCAASLAAGGGIAAYWPPTPRTRSYIQHVAAGFVFAAVGVEVLPDVVHRGLPLATVLGFALGVALMLVIRTVSQKVAEGGGRLDWTSTGVIAADVLIDGLLVGVSSVTERSQGRQALLVTVALSVELLSLGLSMVATMGQTGAARSRVVLTTGVVALSPLAGTLAGYFVGGTLSGAWIEAVLAFAAAAFLYMAAEELLKEAHEVPESLLSTALFFAAFLGLLLIDMVSAKTMGR